MCVRRASFIITSLFPSHQIFRLLPRLLVPPLEPFLSLCFTHTFSAAIIVQSLSVQTPSLSKWLGAINCRMCVRQYLVWCHCFRAPQMSSTSFSFATKSSRLRKDHQVVGSSSYHCTYYTMCRRRLFTQWPCTKRVATIQESPPLMALINTQKITFLATNLVTTFMPKWWRADGR
jgi:hypothetical protein